MKGTKPLSQRKGPGTGDFVFTPRNPLDIPEALKKEIESKGLEYRWLDAKQMADHGNLHKNYWEIYRRDPDVDGDIGVFNSSPDKTIRSGTVILGVRPKRVGDGHRQHLEESRKRQNRALRNAGRAFSEELRQRGVYSKDEMEVGEEVVTRPRD